jgi:hypothetical protein
MGMSYVVEEIDDMQEPQNVRERYRLTAKTDKGARSQAKKLAEASGWDDYTILFYRSEDGCRGELSK